jgi:hypothetical protein
VEVNGDAPATANLTAPLNSTGTIAVTCTAGAVAEFDMITGANGTHAVMYDTCDEWHGWIPELRALL